MISWRASGASMGTIDLREFKDGQIVIHFGGELTSVDAYTFSNSLMAFADTIRAVNNIVNPGQNIEIRLDSVGPGSFRAVVKKIQKGIGGLFSEAHKHFLWMLVGAAIVDPLFEGERTIEFLDDKVIIREGGDELIISREAFDQFESVRNDPKVQRGIRRTFETIERDESVENFGLTPAVNDDEPLVQIPRDDFARIAHGPAVEESSETRRKQRNTALIIVLKPWVDASNRKWSFEWNGVPISAYVKHDEFLAQVANHSIRFGNGDALEVVIEYFQDYDSERDVWVNDTSTFEIVEVIAFLPNGGDRREI